MKQILTNIVNQGYTITSSASSETAVADLKESALKNVRVGEWSFTRWLNSQLAELATLSTDPDSAQNCETRGTDSEPGTSIKGAKAAPVRKKPTHQQRRREQSTLRRDLRKQAEHEWFVSRFGKFVSRETGTLFVEADLDFDLKRQDLEKKLKQINGGDPVSVEALVADLVGTIASELLDDDDPRKSPTLTGLIAAFAPREKNTGKGGR